jgi:hypothetical protein
MQLPPCVVKRSKLYIDYVAYLCNAMPHHYADTNWLSDNKYALLLLLNTALCRICLYLYCMSKHGTDMVIQCIIIMLLHVLASMRIIVGWPVHSNVYQNYVASATCAP